MFKNVSKRAVFLLFILLSVFSCTDEPSSNKDVPFSGVIKFSAVSSLFNGGVGLREFFLTITVGDITKETTVDFIVSGSETGAGWSAVKNLPAKYSRAFTKAVPRELYFSATDKYNKNDATNAIVDLSQKGAKTPAGFMIPGQTYYVHAYSSGKFVSSSGPITLQNYPDEAKLPISIAGGAGSVWAADVKPGKTYDENDPTTYFSKSATKDTPIETGSQSAYQWGVDFWRNNKGDFQGIKLRREEINFIPLRLIRPFKASLIAGGKIEENREDGTERNLALDETEVCAPATTFGIPVLSMSPDGKASSGGTFNWRVVKASDISANFYGDARRVWFENHYKGVDARDIVDNMFLMNEDNGNINAHLRVKADPLTYDLDMSCLDKNFNAKMKKSYMRIYVVDK